MLYHHSHHKQEVTFGVTSPMPQQTRSLTLGQFFIHNGFANQFPEAHLFTSFFEKPLHNFSPGGALYEIQRNP